MKRKFVQIAVAASGDVVELYAVADDGTLWELWANEWHQSKPLPDAPITQAERQMNDMQNRERP